MTNIYEGSGGEVAAALPTVADVADGAAADAAVELARISAGIRDLYAYCVQRARDNGDFYDRSGSRYELGKATVWDGVAEMLRELLPDVAAGGDR